MIKLPFVLAIALSFAATGCKKKGGDCAAAIDHSMELATADMKKMPGMDDKLVGTLKALSVQHCKDDKWSDEAIACMTDAKAEADAQACYAKLSKEQQDTMNSAMVETMMKAAGAGGPAPAAAAGSAAPAPAAGSAGSAATPAAGGSSAATGSGSAH